MRISRCRSCLVVTMLSVTCFSGEILYQDYLDESVLLSVQDVEANAWMLPSLDWNYFFESNSLALATKIRYKTDEGAANYAFRPIIARYDFNGEHEPVGKSIRRASTCYRSIIPIGTCMVGLDSFLFSYDEMLCPKTAFMRISDSTQVVVDITRDVDGMILHGALSATERAAFPSGEGFAFRCGNANDSGLLLWKKGSGSLWPIPSRLRGCGYVCLSSGRVLCDELDTSTARTRTRYSLHSSPREGQHVQVASNVSVTESREHMKMNASCYRVLPCRDAGATQNSYADWDCALSNKILSLGRDSLGRHDWSIELHGMEAMSSDCELGHELAEGNGVLYDFSCWKIFRIRKSDPDWNVLDLKEFFSEDIEQAKACVPLSVLHRGAGSWYYALLFEYEVNGGVGRQLYRIRIVEVPHNGEKYFLWSFPNFKTKKKLQTFEMRSPGVVHKLHDDSWVFLSNTCTCTNDAIFVQRMTGSREEMHPAFKSR